LKNYFFLIFLLIGNAIKRPANAPYTVVLRDDDVIEQTVSQPKTEAYAKPAAAPIAVIIKVNFIINFIKI
jgi:hypothetical protein